VLPFFMASLHFDFKFDSSLRHFWADRLSDLAVNFKLNIWSNKRVSARFFGFMRSNRPIVIVSFSFCCCIILFLVCVRVCVVLVYKSGDFFVVGAFNYSQTEAFTPMRFAQKLNVF
jgi:hypothetical protein